MRECREETGWDVAVTGLFGSYSDPVTQVHRYDSTREVHFFDVVLSAALGERVGSPDRSAAACSEQERLRRRLVHGDGCSHDGVGGRHAQVVQEG